MKYKGYTILPIEGKRTSKNKPVKVYRKDYYIDTYDNLKIAKSKIDNVGKPKGKKK